MTKRMMRWYAIWKLLVKRQSVSLMMPDIEWSKATGLRNIVAHAYFGINNEILWDVVQNKIPPMKAAVDSFMEKRGKL
jgi:uncharacterized protein with HEPN domain